MYRPILPHSIMHGSHFLKDEYEISSSRRASGSPKQSNVTSSKFPSSKFKGESSPAAKKLNLFTILSRILLTCGLIIVGLLKSIEMPRLIKMVAISQALIYSFAPNLMITKRSPNNSEKIMEILPAPLNLIISFDNPNNLTSTKEKDPITHVINQNNITNLFEGIAFSWCDSYVKNKRYPTKLTIVAPSQVKSCIMGQYRWSLKIPSSLINFNSTNTNFNNLTCSKNDPFDCGNGNKEDREEIRLKYSKKCPEMAPILLACTNRMAMERASSYKPSWST